LLPGEDGGVALVITSAERARDLKQAPVYIMSGMGGQGQTSGLWETNGANSAPLLYEGVGITPRDVSIAEIYDPFTFMCMTHIEDFGLPKTPPASITTHRPSASTPKRCSALLA
jgi:acetyl-CoA acetyltransferase